MYTVYMQNSWKSKKKWKYRWLPGQEPLTGKVFNLSNTLLIKTDCAIVDLQTEYLK